MPYLTNLAVIARRTGFPVVEEWGWKSRGHGPMSAVRSVICHHDAANQGPSTFNTVVRDGRAGLPGPLAQFALRRDGTIHVVAAGLSYHAGSNINPSLYNNSYALGIEAGNNGVGEPWPRRQLDAYEALCAELCKAYGLPVSRVRGHKEIAPRRKIDPAGINMDHFRAAVARRMNGDDDMPSAREVADEVWKTWILNRETGRKEYAETLLGSMQERIDRTRLEPIVAKLDTLIDVLATPKPAVSNPDYLADTGQFARNADHYAYRNGKALEELKAAVAELAEAVRGGE